MWYTLTNIMHLITFFLLLILGGPSQSASIKTSAPREGTFEWPSCPDLLAVLANPLESQLNVYPSIKQNEWSYHEVRTTDEKRIFDQEEVYLHKYPKLIQIFIHKILELSGNGWGNSVEIGFFVVQLDNGSVHIGSPFSSMAHGRISEQHINENLKLTLAGLPISNVKRVQFYHTHPRSPMARTLSRGDADQAIRIQKLVATLGANVPFDMHAVPYELVLERSITFPKPQPLGGGPKEPDVVKPVIPTILRMTVPPPVLR
jgi:hypothetical protein